MRITIHTRVEDVREEFMTVLEGGKGHLRAYKRVSRGLFLYMEGSYEGLYIGQTNDAGFQPGDAIAISLEKRDEPDDEEE